MTVTVGVTMGGGRGGLAARVSVAATEKKFWDRVRKLDSCWEWTGSYSDGRPVHYVGKQESGSSYVYAHHFSLRIIGEDVSGRIVTRLCDNGRCVRPEHLAHANSTRTYPFKKCRACREMKPSTEFRARASNADGMFSYCNPCQVTYARRGALRKYGLSLEEFNEMSEQQCGACAACGEVAEQLVVDHNHETGEVRALLCGGCNIALGQCKEDPKRLRKLAAYAERMTCQK